MYQLSPNLLPKLLEKILILTKEVSFFYVATRGVAPESRCVEQCEQGAKLYVSAVVTERSVGTDESMIRQALFADFGKCDDRMKLSYY